MAQVCVTWMQHAYSRKAHITASATLVTQETGEPALVSLCFALNSFLILFRGVGSKHLYLFVQHLGTGLPTMFNLSNLHYLITRTVLK